ncbi:MYB DNA-binding domain protein [Aspergillus nomiae NRRL 13137]|uniref:MYB DNA-binding domain protein n=1 Tax=Aspergillus nomiae NRRL (strain ATCC 15546 / NRRL 13137 / CBS 260.88 / M93) TaxID=1509407 RepID=A0A0L1IL71_ASPN3|nr:MYB DNA-binding domain protein [Aspergillus nomiae NRRL 13137]KNG80356.1 MYB DNA-binding domain protein [Aspergillus nomiae NRRL 13137]
MDSNGTFARSFDESLTRELPQLQSLRIAPLRQPVSSRILSIPSPLEPNASGVREPNSIPKTNNSTGVLPGRNDSSGLTESVNAARAKKIDHTVDAVSSLQPPPKPILPEFVNLRALERFPYSSFDDDSHARKRRRLEVQADSFGEHLQLPIPQAHKEPRPPPFGPFAILNGLNEPPPNAALLPPIEPGSITQLLTKPSRGTSFVEPVLLTANTIVESQSVERREGRIHEILDSPVGENTVDGEQTTIEGGLFDDASVDPIGHEKGDLQTDKEAQPCAEEKEPLSPKTRGRSRKNLRKWTEEETTALLRGVVKCGIGNWTAILAQPELKFNKRSASNLKDRFRVCCPWAYRAADPNEATKKLRDTLADALSRAETEGADGAPGKIRLPHPWPVSETPPGGISAGSSQESLSSSGTPTEESELKNLTSQAKPASAKTGPTLSSKSKSTLASLGIPEPHFTIKSRRRSRRPFTVAEDEALLKGYAVHGFQWTLIQQDKRLNLGHRRATDLRDRFRTKFPHAYRDGGSVSGNSFNQSEESGLKDGKDRASSSKRNLQPTKQLPSSQNGKSDNSEQSALGPIDPALSPPAPPPGLPLESVAGAPSTAVFSFPLDENTANPSGVDPSWADNTLAPMVWDELS